jgi:hypothetical protein
MTISKGSVDGSLDGADDGFMVGSEGLARGAR